MTPITSAFFCCIEQILLLIFVLMILVSMAGGKADNALKASFSIVTYLLSAAVGLLCSLIAFILKLMLTLSTNTQTSLTHKEHSASTRSADHWSDF